MRLSDPGIEPKITETEEKPEAKAGSPAPSYPDRARIDSDVRALLRQPSTPWIVFDKDSRVDQAELRRSHLSAGDVLVSSRASSLQASSVIDEPPAAGAPALAAAHPPAPADVKAVEPSGMTVATDLLPDAAPTVRPTSFSIDVEELSVGTDEGLAGLPVARSGRLVGFGIAAAATLLAVVGVLVLRPAGAGPAQSAAAPSTDHAAPSTDAKSAAPSRAAIGADEVPPPEAAPATAADAADAPAPKVAAAATPDPVKDAKPGKKASKFGRLSIAGDARFKNVFFDGKRMLGKGTRGFAVLCGTHTIAVGEKTDVREVEVPCDGEYVVNR